MYICICKSVTDSQIRNAVSEGACSMRALCQNLGTCTQCGKCAEHVLSELRQALSDAPAAPRVVFPVNVHQEAA